MEVQLEVPPSEADDVRGHPGRAHQVLVNLMLNAAQALGGSTGHIRVARVEVDGAVELWVEDAGPGVPDDLQEAIFDPFFTTKDPGEGTGLGLAVSRSLMEAMDGDLRYESGADGAIFIVRFAPAGPTAATD